GRSLYTTDRGHLHHRLLSRGLSIRSALLWISFFCSLTVVGALASLALNNELVAVVSALTVAGILIGVRLFGHAEFMLARQPLSARFLPVPVTARRGPWRSACKARRIGRSFGIRLRYAPKS